LLALVEDGARHPLDRALPGAGLDHRRCAVERGVKRGTEVRRAGIIVEVVGGFAAHPHGMARIGDAAARSERLEEFLLPFACPAVVADAARGEIGCWFW